MPDYVCEACDKVFQRKAHLDYHVNNESCKKREFLCKYCDKGFTTSANMYRHMKHSCKIKQQDDTEKENILDRLLRLEHANKELAETSKKESVTSKKEIDQLKKENNVLKKKVDKLAKINTVSKIVNTTNINKGTVNNIILVGYGQEDISRIDRNEVIKALQNGFNSSIKLTEILHFNPKYPEYHNVYISNMKDKYAMTYDGKDWNLIIKEDLINKIYDDKKNYIEENLDDFVDSLSTSRMNALNRWIETDDEDDRISKIKHEIKLLLYNKRDMVESKKNKAVKIVKKFKI
jgi:hypothetical protein